MPKRLVDSISSFERYVLIVSTSAKLKLVIPSTGGGRGWVCSFKSTFLFHFAFLTHPYPSTGGDKAP